MKLSKSDLGYIERRFRDSFTVGYCKACRQWDVLLFPKRYCSTCLGFCLKETNAEQAESILYEKGTK